MTSSWPVPTRAYTTWMQQVVIDARRTLDYLETRPDIDGKQVAYYGVSWGARLAPVHHRARFPRSGPACC